MKAAPNSTHAPLTVTLEIGDNEIVSCNAFTPTTETDFAAQMDRTAVVYALQAVSPGPKMGTIDVVTPLADHLGEGALKETVKSEVLLALQDDKFGTWGVHYVRTLPQMLRAGAHSPAPPDISPPHPTTHPRQSAGPTSATPASKATARTPSGAKASSSA